MIRVLVCEDETIVREGLVALLSFQHGITVVGEAVNGEDALKQIEELSPDVVLIDVRMPIMDGVQATQVITSHYPKTRVVILTTFDYEEYVLEGVKAGASGYVLKDTSADELVSTIRRVHRGEHFIQAAVASRILVDMMKPQTPTPVTSESATLTDREIAILTLLSQGMSNREVAADLNLSEGTIKNYVSAILTKLQVTNRIQAINVAREQKLI